MTKTVLLFLSQGFEAFEASVFTDVMGWSREVGNQPVNLITTALRPEIKCTWNLIVKPELEFNKVNVNNFDALAIPGGFETAGFYEDAFDQRFLELIKQFDQQSKTIASICVGALPIAKSGVLNNRYATTYDYNEPNNSRQTQLQNYGAILKNQNIVIDKNIITSTGPSTSLDVAFKLLEILTNTENVNTVKKHMRI